MLSRSSFGKTANTNNWPDAGTFHGKMGAFPCLPLFNFRVMNKYRLLKALESVPDEMGSMSVSDLKNKIKKEVEFQKSEQDKAEKEVCDKYSGKYIKEYNEDGLFGRLEVKYIRIDEIKPGSMTTDWQRCYDIKGEVISFSGNYYGIREMNPGHASDSMTKYELDSCKIITEDQYNEAVRKYSDINEIVNQIQQK